MLLVAALKSVTRHTFTHPYMGIPMDTNRQIHYSLKFKLSIRQSKEMNLSVTSLHLKEVDSGNYLYNLLYFITHVTYELCLKPG